MSEVICVENDAKVDARCHTLKIDIGNLKCTKFDAKEKEKKEKKKEKEKKEKEKEKEKREKKKENIRMFSPKFPFHANQKKTFYSTRNQTLFHNIRIVWRFLVSPRNKKSCERGDLRRK